MNTSPNISVINSPGFKRLVKAIREEIEQGRSDVEGRLAKMYWRIGRHISRDILQNKRRAGYGGRLFDNLSKILKVDDGTLHKSVKFYERYPILCARPELSWNHYKVLLTVGDKRKRFRLEEAAKRKKMTVSQLKNRARKLNKTQRQTEAVLKKGISKLPVVRGELFCYKVLGPLAKEKGKVALDCGFNIRRNIIFSRAGNFKTGDIIRVVKSKSGFAAEKAEIPSKKLFTYKAYLERVIDGDTIFVNIDCGFDTWIRQKLRFRSINTPEIKTTKGKKAKEFVQKRLGKLDFFVIKTYGFGKYDRALVDVFYLPNEKDARKTARNGIFLNQELLDNGLAELWQAA